MSANFQVADLNGYITTKSQSNQSDTMLHWIHQLDTFSHVRLCNPMDYSPSGFSVHRVPQARILEWVAISSSKGSSQSRDRIHICCIACIGGWILTQPKLDMGDNTDENGEEKLLLPSRHWWLAGFLHCQVCNAYAGMLITRHGWHHPKGIYGKQAN